MRVDDVAGAIGPRQLVVAADELRAQDVAVVDHHVVLLLLPHALLHDRASENNYSTDIGGPS